MRKALVVGINTYKSMPALYGCAHDAEEVRRVLERNADGTKNFDVKFLSATGNKNLIYERDLRKQIEQLFKGNSDIALFYFAGHGYISQASGEGFLLTSDSESGEDGINLEKVMALANRSDAKNKIIILDSCHSGAAGNDLFASKTARLPEGMTILTASTADQYASEEKGSGVFTSLFIHALDGAAGNLIGEVTPGSVYAHIDQSLGSWSGQRPVFKTNVERFVCLRKAAPPIPLTDLHKITEFFPIPHFEYKLDPSFEPDSPSADKERTKKFKVLQKYNRVNLVVPVEEDHMYYAAMNSKSCKLTMLGEHYHRLVKTNRI